VASGKSLLVALLYWLFGALVAVYPWRGKMLDNITARAPPATITQPIAAAISCSSIQSSLK
jgi:hypothetical protein